MNNITRTISITGVMLFCSSLASAATEIPVAVVNVTDLFNTSTYVQKANKQLQENTRQMEEKLKTAQSTLQEKISTYQATKNSKKKDDMAKSISTDQAKLNDLTRKYQLNISEEQNKGMQAFTNLVKIAVQKVAKDKNIHTVINSVSVVYTDNTWVDITKDVEAVMAKE